MALSPSDPGRGPGVLDGNRRLMGTDYPFDMGPTDPLGFLAEARLGETQLDLILGENAARLLRIPG